MWTQIHCWQYLSQCNTTAVLLLPLFMGWLQCYLTWLLVGAHTCFQTMKKLCIHQARKIDTMLPVNMPLLCWLLLNQVHGLGAKHPIFYLCVYLRSVVHVRHLLLAVQLWLGRGDGEGVAAPHFWRWQVGVFWYSAHWQLQWVVVVVVGGKSVGDMAASSIMYGHCWDSTCKYRI